MSKTIPLTQGKFALVDNEDYQRLINVTWYAHYDGFNWYALSNESRRLGKRKTIKMHRFILGVTNSDVQVDHINRNGLDNRRENIRLTKSRGNQHNTKTRKDNTSGYKGVSLRKETGKYRAYVNDEKGKRVYVGEFEDIYDAVFAREKAEAEIIKNLFGTDISEEAERKEETA